MKAAFWKYLIIYLVIVLIGTLIVIPFLWTVTSSLKTNGDIFAGEIIPSVWTFEQYTRLFSETLFPRWLLNSLIVALGSTIIGVFSSALGGYAFAKFTFKGRDLLFWLIMATITIPPFALLIPLFSWLGKIGLMNTYWALILPFAVAPMGIFFMRQYIRSLPDDLLDSARIDGANEYSVFLLIVLPLIRPAIAAVAITMFLDAWNSYVYPLVLIHTDDMMPFTLGLASLNSVYFIEYGMLMAGAVVSTIPFLLIFIFLQREYISGLTRGAVKA